MAECLRYDRILRGLSDSLLDGFDQKGFQIQEMILLLLVFFSFVFTCLFRIKFNCDYSLIDVWIR